MIELASALYKEAGKNSPLVHAAILKSVTAFARSYPDIPEQSFWIFLARDLIPNPKQLFKDITEPFFSRELIKAELFTELRKQLEKNMHYMHGKAYSGLTHFGYPEFPATFDNLDDYIFRTPFKDFYNKIVPVDLQPTRILPEHATIFAQSGWGKTQLLGYMTANYLYNYPPMSMWIIDSQGDLLNKISRLHRFNPDDGLFKDRVVIIDPEDTSPPALNLFDLGTRDALTEDLFLYMFSAIDNTLTPQQSTTVTYLMRLMHSIPGATINTLRQVLQDNSKSMATFPFLQHIEQLDEITKDFFEHQFFQAGAMQVTKHSIARRLFALQANETFNKMFAATTNAFNAQEAIEQKKIVLINTSQKALGDGSTVLGRFFIAQALAAAYRRPPHQSDTALLIVDEAAPYFDYQTERILSTARKYSLGLLAASQYLEQVDNRTKAAIHGNTTTKIAGALSFQDANALSREMNIDPELFKTLEKTEKGSDFLVYVRSITQKAIKTNIPFFTLEGFDKMTDEQYARMRKANRERYGTPSGAPLPSPPMPAPAPIPNYEDPSKPSDKQWI